MIRNFKKIVSHAAIFLVFTLMVFAPVFSVATVTQNSEISKIAANDGITVGESTNQGLKAGETLNQGLKNEGGTGGLTNPLGNDVTLVGFINLLLEKVVMPIGAVVATLAIIYSGFLFATAGGSDEKISNAKKSMTYAVVGAGVLLGSIAISKAIEGTINQIKG